MQRGLRIDALYHHGPLAGDRVEQVDVDLRPLHHHVHEHVATVTTDGDIGPRFRCRLAVEHDGVGGVIGAQPVEANMPVVLRARLVHGVPEARIVWQPRNAGGARIGNPLCRDLASGDVHHVQHAVLGAAFAQTVRHMAAVGRGVIPVDGYRTVSCHLRRIEQRSSGCTRISRATDDQRVLICAGSTLQQEQVVASDLQREHRRQRRERGKALMPPTPSGSSIERLTSSLIVCCYPRSDLGRFTVLQPPIRIRYLDVVIHVGLGTTPRGGCRG